jgi:hypothetical protein
MTREKGGYCPASQEEGTLVKEPTITVRSAEYSLETSRHSEVTVFNDDNNF